MDETFKHHLHMLVASLLAPDKLVTKKTNGREISCREWVTYFSKHAEIFQNAELPEPRSLLEATALLNNEAAMNEAKARYENGMQKEFGEKEPFKTTWNLLCHHHAQRKAALKLFTAHPKMGGHMFSEKYQKILEKEI
ncbi:atlastin-2-like [Haemaphysalis longicornis]